MLKWLRSLWFHLSCLDFTFDLEDSLCFDLLAIQLGTEKSGLFFHGSLFMIYYEPRVTHHGRTESHFAWDFCYLRQTIAREG
jgi:hypothetical protein